MKRVPLKFRRIYKKTSVPENLFIKVAYWKSPNFFQNETPTLVFSCKFYQIIKNTYFREHLQTAASEVASVKTRLLINIVRIYSYERLNKIRKNRLKLTN